MSHSSSIQDLLSHQVVHIGTKAKNNPTSVDFPRFAAGIANKDYPAQTPMLWISVYQELGMAERNVRLYGEPDNVAAIFEAFRLDPHYIGGDVGVGFKTDAIALLDEIDPMAKLMGAINVVVKTPGGLKGFNTDGLGFVQSLEAVFERRGETLHDKKIVLLGAGGTANAIAFPLADCGAKVIILNRTPDKAARLSANLNAHFGTAVSEFAGRDKIAEHLQGADAAIAVIDDPHSPLDKYSALGEITLPESAENIARNLAESEQLLSGLPKTLVVSDVMLRDHDTATIAQAKSLGFETLDGKPMVLNQAVEAFILVNHDALAQLGVDRARIRTIMQAAQSAQAA